MKSLLLALSIFGIFASQTTFASTQGKLSLCPQDGRNNVNEFHTDLLAIGKVKVNVAAGGSEPNFSSEIQWDQNGVVTLVRKDKNTIVLGQGERPDLSSPCGTFPFTLNDQIQIETRSRGGLPYPVCDFENGCHIVHPQNDTVIIHDGNDAIIYVGNWG